MVGAISGAYNSVYFPGAISRTAPVWSARRLSNPEAAVEPVTPVRPTPDVSTSQGRLFRQELPTLRQGVDPVEWAVRMRIQQGEGAEAPQGARQPAEETIPGLSNGEGMTLAGQPGGENVTLPGQPSRENVTLPGQPSREDVSLPGQPSGENVTLPGLSGKDMNLPGEKTVNLPSSPNEKPEDLPGLPNEKVENLPGLPGEEPEQSEDGKAVGAEGVQEAAEEGKCQTCEERKYQDGSDDPGVSFKTPTNVAPEMAASAVRGHEMEHVVREQAKAQREDRKVVSQSVTYHTGICPECGRVYVSGGTTRTVTAANPQEEQPDPEQRENASPFAPAAIA